MEVIIFLALALLAVLIYLLLSKDVVNEEFVSTYEFPETVRECLAKSYSMLSDEELDMVISGLRQFFVVCGKNNLRWCMMPSKVIDEAWHQFILNTKEYQFFCNKAYGKFLHHSPSRAMSSQTKAQIGIQRAWKSACKLERMSPNAVTRIPLLFAIDYKLQISDGYYYVLNCEMPSFENLPRHYCAGHIMSSNAGVSGDGCGGGCGGG
jgi:hypothetical protein